MGPNWGQYFALFMVGLLIFVLVLPKPKRRTKTYTREFMRDYYLEHYGPEYRGLGESGYWLSRGKKRIV
jgi:hypothetical protein